MILLSPWWCLIVLFALLPWVGPWRGSNLVQNVLRSLVFIFLGLALAQPRMAIDNQRVDRVLIIDRSKSVTTDAKDAITNQLSKFSEAFDSKTCGHLVVIGEPLANISASQFKSVSQLSSETAQGSSPLAAAIARAQSLIPNKGAGSVTIASDSLATRSDDDRAIAALRANKIPIHWIELRNTERPPTPVQVRWPDALRQGTSSRLIVRVVSTAAASGEVTLMHDNEALAAAPFNNSNQQQHVELTFEPKEAGFLDCEVVVSSGEESQSLAVVLPIEKPHQLLYLGDLQKGGAEKLSEMLGAGFEVTCGNVDDPTSLDEMLQKTDLVMLDDMPATAIPKEAERQLVDAVQNDGLGIVMSGGRASFGSGGWHSRPIESLLPVELVQKEEKRDPSTSLVIVIDTSGSMTGVRVQLAKEVARLAMRRLLPHDKVGIVEFFGAKRWAAPLQPASNAIELQRALNRMDAGGGTVILPALEEAFYGLQNVDTRYKHVLVLTDGGVEPGDFESLMRRMSGEGINVSTVLAGGGYHSEFLVNIANWGKGRFYNVPNRFNLPEILLKQPSTTKLPAYRPGSHAVDARGGTGWWGDVDMSKAPNLAGYVESKPRVGSQVLLETAKEKHPILTTWRYGLGRVTTLTTEPLGKGTQPWQAWDEYSQALSRILQRSAADARDPFQFNVENDGGKVIVHAIGQKSRSKMTTQNMPVAKVADSDETLNFIRRSPDRFVAFLPAPPKGQSMRIQTSSSATPLRQQHLVVASPTVEETHVDPQASIDLGKLADVAGGQRFSLTSDWINAPTSIPTGRTFWSPASWLFGLSLLLFLVEIVWRRLPAPNASRVTVAATFLIACLTVGQQSFAQDAAASNIRLNEQLATEANSLINDSIENGVDRSKVDQLFRSVTTSDGSVEKLLPWLAESRSDINQRRGQVVAEIEVHVASRRGDLKRAANVLTELLTVKTLRDQRTDLQIWHAKLHDALGDVAEARKLYESLADQKLSDREQQTVRLRLALIGLIDSNKKSAGAKPLIEMAENSEDLAFRNRAAIVLAVQGQPAEAIKLFSIQGEGTARFRSASRVTEWAIRAKDREKAITAAWDAVNSAQLKRDRNYALALLVESYRLKENTEGLEQLVNELTQKNDSNEPMADETRLVWISLLRELGRYDDAIKLFRSTVNHETGFTIEMRRELLEMEGESGNEERMIQSYHELIQSEPNEMTWRSGLTQILLEKGLDAEARALWTNFVNESTNATTLLHSAKTLGEFGIDDLAQATIERMVQLKANEGQALLYWADLQQRRGNIDVAEQTLNRIQSMDGADNVRAELAGAFERIGRQDKAIEVNEAIRASRETVAEDLELRLAWLYSEVGDEEKAQQQWLELWRKVKSIPRRRYIEDRLMTVASRLGTLADIAIELEEKLADGAADAKEAGLLIRIYSRVNDSVAATEISQEYMAKSGKNQVEQLQEKGRIYQVCHDYWNYEKVIEQLIEVDPAGKTEYLRQLALSMLERGKAQEARDVLMTLRTADDGKDSIGGEFEAGVLSLVGMKAEAAGAYRKGIAAHPDRIESYLLLANLLKDMGETNRAVGMFQFLAENAQRDDLFTIAIDGLLNMGSDSNVMQWARRITLERLAEREDKNYLYQLLSDLSSEVRNKSGQILALENSLAVSGTRRLSVLRECMELSSKLRGGAYSSNSRRGPSNKGNQPFFAFGRRLIGLGELLPPEVFLDLGQAFLADGNSASAERTFGMARNLADPRAYQREVALIFEKAGKTPEALERYDKLLRTSPSDVSLIARVATLNEKERNYEIAYRFYQRGLNLLLSQTPLTTEESKKGPTSRRALSRDAFDSYNNQLRHGLVVTLPDERIDNLLADQIQLLAENLNELKQVRAQGRAVKNLNDSPRIEKRANMIRQLCFALDRIEDLEMTDAALINNFPGDKSLLSKFANELSGWGRYDSIDRMLQNQNLDEAQRKQLLGILGQGEPGPVTSKLPPKAMWQRLLPVWMDGDRESVKRLIRLVGHTTDGSSRPNSTNQSAKVAVWMRLALAMEDEGLALQLARSQIKSSKPKYNATTTAADLKTYQGVLSKKSFGDLVRYTANLYKNDPSRLKDYLTIASNYKSYLPNEALDDQEILNRVMDKNLKLSYQFTLTDAFRVLPPSIRHEAIESMLEQVNEKTVYNFLIQVPFVLESPIDDETARVVLEAFKRSIDVSIRDKSFTYKRRFMPQDGTALKCVDNSQFAISMLDLLMTDKVQNSDSATTMIAESIKAVVLQQSGNTEAAVETVMSFDRSAAINDATLSRTRAWADSEVISTATDRFLDLVEKEIKDGKPTAAQTNERLKYLRLADDENALRSTYHAAIKDYPTSPTYLREYERWEQYQPFRLIEFYENRLADAKESENTPLIIRSKAKLERLYKQVNHLPKALQHASANRKPVGKQNNNGSNKPTIARKTSPSNDARKSKPDAKKKKTYASTIAGVKQAIDNKDVEGAKQAIRRIWRKLPGPKTNRYYQRPIRVNKLGWPSAQANSGPPKQSDLDQETTAEQARIIARGGLATLTVKTKTPVPKTLVNPWEKLAEHPFAIAEMKVIMRQHATPDIEPVRDVSLGLLQATRNQLGDEKAFESVVRQIRSRIVSNEIWLRFFTMLDDDQKLADADSKPVVDVLLSHVDWANVSRVLQLADLCAETGQSERAKALYRYCTLSQSQSKNSFYTMISHVKEIYSGAELMELAESMFELSGQTSKDILELLALRQQHLSPKEAVDRSRSLFDGESIVKSFADIKKAAGAVHLFARSGEHELATKRLTALLTQHGKPSVVETVTRSIYRTPNSTIVPLNVTTDDLIHMFPKDMSQFDDAKKWLADAAAATAGIENAAQESSDIIVKTLLIIAIRQHQIDNAGGAITTLDMIEPQSLADAPRYHLLAIDAMRLAGQTERALGLEMQLYAQGRLTHLRFGDLLRDMHKVNGPARAAELLDELAELSMDKDLLAAAAEIAANDESLRERAEELQAAQDKAEKEVASHSDKPAKTSKLQ